MVGYHGIFDTILENYFKERKGFFSYDSSGRLQYIQQHSRVQSEVLHIIPTCSSLQKQKQISKFNKLH